MARVPGEELERIKREVSLVALAEARGVKLAPHGADLIGLCPFHEDHEPSLVVTASKNLWHCLGACQAGGSVIDWVMKAEAVSFRHAVEILRGMLCGVRQSEGMAPAGAAHLSGCALDRLPADPDDAALVLQVARSYHENLKASPEALRYLEFRGLQSSEMIDHFKLGFANRTLAYRIPEQEGKQTRARLQRLGVLRASGHEHLTGCITIPIFDEKGQVAGMYGRRIGRNFKAGTPVHLYLPGPHRGVWNFEALATSKEIILCEALIDALTFWCAGFRNVTSAYGVSGFTADHLEAFKKHGTERVLIAYDRDDAGDKAAAALAERLSAEGIDCRRILFPRGMDANLYARKVTPAAKSLEVLIRGARQLAPDARFPEEEAEDEPSDEPPASLAEPPSLLVADPRPSALKDRPPAAPDTLPAPAAAAPKADIRAEVREAEVVIPLGDRRWRIRGLAKNTSFEALKVNVLIGCGEAFHIDTLDLYSAKHRAGFTKEAAVELGIKEDILRKDLAKVLLKLEELQEELIRKALEPKDDTASMTEEERSEALALLRDPKLLDRIGADFEACGLVGEEVNRLVGYLTAVSRKLDRPLAVIVQSSSAAGKSALMEAVLAFVPEEERVQYSAMTGQSLFYMEGANLKHKVLAIAEEEGAERASYALKLLQSEGKLSIASTGKDPASGKLVTSEYHVEGPVAILLTSTAIDIDEELLNRCIVLCVDEGREQTRAIHRMQRRKRTLEGLVESLSRSHLRALHQNAQRLLRPLAVLNPYADALTFVDDVPRTRRDHEKYLTLIDTIALLHQHQRPVRAKVLAGERLEYVEATLADVALANRLAAVALGRTLDELPPQTRRLLLLTEEMVAEACRCQEIDRADYRFSRRRIREHSGYNQTQLRVHLERLVEMEYLLVHRGSRGQGFVYELLYDGQGKDGKPFLLGLLDVEKLGRARARPRYDDNLAGVGANLAGQEAELAGPKRSQNAPVAGGWRVGSTAALEAKTLDFEPEAPKNAYRGGGGNGSAHVVALVPDSGNGQRATDNGLADA